MQIDQTNQLQRLCVCNDQQVAEQQTASRTNLLGESEPAWLRPALIQQPVPNEVAARVPQVGQWLWRSEADPQRRLQAVEHCPLGAAANPVPVRLPG